MRIISNEGKSIGCKVVKPAILSQLSEERLEILRMLCREPHYPAQIARRMGMKLQTIYYHIRILEKAGLIEFIEYEEHNGGVAKRYAAGAKSIAIIVDDNGWKEATAAPKQIPGIIRPFVEHGYFDGLVVVGSPDPHGKYRARGSEFGIAEIAMLLGNYAPPAFPLYSLDTQITTEDRRKNLILVGGPKVNTLVAEINGALPVRYSKEFGEVYSRVTQKRYSGNIGVVELIPNPDARDRHILAVGGLNFHGTMAAVLALVKKGSELGEKGKAMARVVEGFDEDGDGRVDSVEILE